MIFLNGVHTGGHNGLPICFRPVKVPICKQNINSCPILESIVYRRQ
jgi:hypothetical protein